MVNSEELIGSTEYLYMARKCIWCTARFARQTNVFDTLPEFYDKYMYLMHWQIFLQKLKPLKAKSRK